MPSLAIVTHHLPFQPPELVGAHVEVLDDGAEFYTQIEGREERLSRVRLTSLRGSQVRLPEVQVHPTSMLQSLPSPSVLAAVTGRSS